MTKKKQKNRDKRTTGRTREGEKDTRERITKTGQVITTEWRLKRQQDKATTGREEKTEIAWRYERT